jgi:hypothetical protein
LTVLAAYLSALLSAPARLLQYLPDRMLVRHEQDDNVTVLVMSAPGSSPLKTHSRTDGGTRW